MEILACDTRSIELDLIIGLPQMTDEIRYYIATASSSSQDDDELMSRTELYMHTNMAVVERHAYILKDTRMTAEVNAFTPDHAPMKIKIVDASVQYNCLYDGTIYILVTRNVLHVESMSNNIIHHS